ncbi:MAG TPA: hypothetical protein VFP84_40285 [Kofleriaceae bacterium]|nr:hypothetical protein [Kofleriaceae bacterium]
MSRLVRMFALVMWTAACHRAAHPRGAGEVGANDAPAAPPVHTTQDDLAAADHACDAVEPYACAVLGVRHELAHGVPADDPVARRFFARACERGEPHGCLWLAEDRFVVSGGNPEAAGTAEAAHAAQEGCQFGSGAACDLAGRFALAIHDESTAVRWEDEACRLGMVASCRYLIRHDMDPPDTPVDTAKLYAEACQDHIPSACQQTVAAAPAKPTPSTTPADPRPQLAARAFAGLRLSGDAAPPDPSTLTQLQHMGSPRLTGVFKLCITERGEVTSVDLYKPTGAIAYDRKLARTLFRWTYRPHVVAGAPVAACGEVVINYPK